MFFMNKKTILHIQFTGPYTEKANYQENILPKYHSRMGYRVIFLTTCYEWQEGVLTHIKPEEKYMDDNVYLKRMDFVFIISDYITRRIRYVKNLYHEIDKIHPSIIMLHDVQSFSDISICRYLRKHKDVKMIVDCHTDYSNSAIGWFSNHILHGIIWKFMAQYVNMYTYRFYGVLPARVSFLEKKYKLPRNKVRLLVMGADDDLVLEYKNDDSKKNIREKYGYSANDFLIITGGKIDKAKRQTLLLMQAMQRKELCNAKLLVFGSVEECLKQEFDNLLVCKNIQYIGWVSANLTYELLSAADLVVFPGRHSVLWEQTVALGIPLVVKYWDGTTHVDIGGNVEFIYRDSEDEICKILDGLVNNHQKYKKMLENSNSESKNRFLYSRIAKECLDGIM